MLEFAVITILIIATFVGVAWYARQSSQQRTKLLEEIDTIEPELGDSDKFSALFEQEVQQQQIDNEAFELDAEPRITLSEDAVPEVLPQVEAERIDITIDDEENSDEATLVEQESKLLEDEEQSVADSDDSSTQQIVNDWDMVIAFTVMAREGKTFSGRSIKATLESLDLHFGDLQIYHRALPGVQSQTLFSVANILDPGTLNPDSFATMTTPGLLIFTRLPGPINGLTLFDDLLDAAQKMTDKLDGVLCDESRQAINQTTTEAMRSRILSLNLQLQTEQNNYNND